MPMKVLGGGEPTLAERRLRTIPGVKEGEPKLALII
jgi:hypothetical protein